MEASNVKAMREAVQSILNLAYEVAAETEEPRCKISNDWLIKTCKAALAAPARNCDVGTAEEQFERYEKFCDSHKCADGSTVCSPRCPLYKTLHCALHWAQMPYENEVKK